VVEVLHELVDLRNHLIADTGQIDKHAILVLGVLDIMQRDKLQDLLVLRGPQFSDTLLQQLAVPRRHCFAIHGFAIPDSRLAFSRSCFSHGL
jgi:hypothetical protein